MSENRANTEDSEESMPMKELRKQSGMICSGKLLQTTTSPSRLPSSASPSLLLPPPSQSPPSPPLKKNENKQTPTSSNCNDIAQKEQAPSTVDDLSSILRTLSVESCDNEPERGPSPSNITCDYEVGCKPIPLTDEYKNATQEEPTPSTSNGNKRDNFYKCKICFQEDLCVLFLPCCHLVSGVVCALSVSNCTICGEIVTGWIKVNFDN